MLFSSKKNNKVFTLKLFNSNKNIKIDIKSKVYNIDLYKKIYLSSNKSTLTISELNDLGNIYVKKIVNKNKSEYINNILKRYYKEDNIFNIEFNNACSIILDGAGNKNNICMKQYYNGNYFYNRIIELGLIIHKLYLVGEKQGEEDINIDGFFNYLLFNTRNVNKEDVDRLVLFLSFLDIKELNDRFIKIETLRKLVKNTKNLNYKKNLSINKDIQEFIYNYYNVELPLESFKDFNKDKKEKEDFLNNFLNNYLEKNNINKSLFSDIKRKNAKAIDGLYNFYKKQGLDVNSMIKIFNHINDVFNQKGYILNLNTFNKNIEIYYKKYLNKNKNNTITNKYLEVESDDDF